MKTAIQQWGNSLALRIPKAFAQQAKVKKGTPIALSLEKGKLIVTPLLSEEISLKKLLSKVKPGNIHGETAWGAAAGLEM